MNVIDYTTGRVPGKSFPTGRLDPTKQLATSTRDAERHGAGRRRHVPELQRDCHPDHDQQLRSVQRAPDHHLGPRGSAVRHSRFPMRRATSRCCARSAAKDFRSATGRHITHAHTFTPSLLNGSASATTAAKPSVAETPPTGRTTRARVSTSRTHRSGDHVRHPGVQHDGLGWHRLDLAGDRRARRELQFTDNLSFVKGLHNVRAGFQISRRRVLPDHELQRQTPRSPSTAGTRACRRTAIGAGRLPLGVPSRAGAPSATPFRTCRPRTGPATCRTTGASAPT